MNSKVVSVAIPLMVHECYSYLVLGDTKRGDLVKVNFHNKLLIGIVVDIVDNLNNSKIKLKNIEEKLDLSFGEKFVDFLRWVADYNIVPIGLIFKLTFSEKFLVVGKRESNYYKFLNFNDKKITTNQQTVVDFLSNNSEKSFCFDDLKDMCSLNILKTLAKNSIITDEKRQVTKNYDIDLKYVELNKLTAEQEEIFQKIKELDCKKPILLEGITGSGKTEIYFHLFKYYLEQENGNQMLFLLPEIALTSQFLDRFKQQFKCKNVAIWHSNIGGVERSAIWQKVYGGEIRIVIGARSALFLPFKNLKFIALDEEHDNSYKQTDNGCYNARDMANVRAKFEDVKILLGSATPSIESLINVEKHKYEYFYLKSRYGKSVIPVVEVVDLKKEKMKHDKYLSKHLINSMQREFEKGNQVLLFLNRRGYSPIAICRECGHRFLCKNCSCNLAVHNKKQKFICHQCGYSINQTTTCPECGQENSIIFFGPGVEKIEKEVEEIFSDKKTTIITSDTIENTTKFKDIIDKIHSKEIDIIIGTQMITKGYDFQYLTLVGILDADANLFGANFRASERTYQLLTQVVGRVGRREEVGKAILQTYSPDNLIIQSLVENDKDKLLKFEKENRKIASLPPYGKLIMVVFGDKEEIVAYRKLKEFIALFPLTKDVEVLGPTPTNLFRSNGVYRFKVLFKSKSDVNLQLLVLNTVKKIKLGDTKIKIDVNPYFIV
jgi:primosomal protein N' (replication factor Y)